MFIFSSDDVSVACISQHMALRHLTAFSSFPGEFVFTLCNMYEKSKNVWA